MSTVKALNDKAAERAVLAGICHYGSDAFYDVVDMLQPDTFTTTANSALYNCLKYLIEQDDKRKIDVPSVFSASQSLGYTELFNTKNESGYLDAIMSFPVALGNVRAFAAKIRKLQIGRLLHSQLGEAQEKILNVTGDEPIAQILGIAEDSIFDFTSLLNDSDGDPVKLGEDIQDFIQNLIDNPVEQVGISTGFPRYDEAIGGGLRGGTVNVLGARSKQGKSLFTNMASYSIASKQNIPTLYLDTEMRQEEQRYRALAMLSEVPIKDIETGRFGKDNEATKKIVEAGKKLEAAPYAHISIAGKPFEEILAVMRRWLVKDVGLTPDGRAKPCVIFYDYLKLMDAKGLAMDLKEFQLLGFMMTALHNFSVRYDLPIFTLIQLNRDGITGEGTDVISGSDRVLWLCSNFAILKPKSTEELADDPKENGSHKLMVLAARHGPAMDSGDYINMDVRGWCAQMKEGRTRFEIEAGHHDEDELKLDGDESAIPFD